MAPHRGDGAPGRGLNRVFAPHTRSASSPASVARRSWSPTSGCTRGYANPAATRPSTARSPHRAGPTPAASWSRRRGRDEGTGPLRAFYQRVRARRGMQIAVVATARNALPAEDDLSSQL
jgi:hypothetical protein